MSRLESDYEFLTILDMEQKKSPFLLRMSKRKQKILIILIVIISAIWLTTFLFYPASIRNSRPDKSFTAEDSVTYYNILYAIAGVDLLVIGYYVLCNHFYKSAFRQASRISAERWKHKTAIMDAEMMRARASAQANEWSDQLDDPGDTDPSRSPFVPSDVANEIIGQEPSNQD